MQKLSGVQGSPFAQGGGTIKDVPDPIAIQEKLFLSHNVFKFICLKRGEAHFLER